MKKYLIFASVVACLAVSGCVKAKKDFADDQVSFSASTGTLDTRTDYGVDGSDGGTSFTYVNWVAGDKIKILSSTGSSDTYTVSEVHDGSYSQGISKGNVTPDGSGIAWGTGQQTFYAMYPANVSGSSLTSSTMTCVIPATWTPTSDAELGQLPYGYMFAKTTTSRTTSVSLTFDPKFTSFTFTLKNPTATAVTLSSFTLSSATKAMNGTYTVNTSNGNVALPTAGNNNKSITVNLSSLNGGSGLSIPAGTTANPGTKTFTLVTVPNSFDDLSISCTIDGVTSTRDLKKNGSFLTFGDGLKHNISFFLPGTAPVENSFTIYFGGTLVGDSSSATYDSNDPYTFQTSWTSNDSDKQRIFPYSTYSNYIYQFASVPVGSNHNPIRGLSDHIDIDDFISSSEKDGIVIELKSTYWKTPTSIEIRCSATSTNSKLFVQFFDDNTSPTATQPIGQTVNNYTFPVYTSSESANTEKTLTFTTSNNSSVPGNGNNQRLRGVKLLNRVHREPVSIYYIKVNF